jgi:hypothetical protein
VKGEPDGLRGRRFQAQPGATNSDTKVDEVGEKRELGANQVLDIDPFPFIPNEQVLTG